MKVKLAVQCIASHSVASALRWCHDNEFDGFKDIDVLATSDFIDLLDKTFDILNSRNVLAKGYKRSLTTDHQCILRTEEVFTACEEMLQSVTQPDGTKLLLTPRRTGPMGIICSMNVVRFLLNEMMSKNIALKYLLTYKLSQDHIELFFGAIRLRNGCCFNPTPRQLRISYRRLLVHAGRSINPTNGNCVAQVITCVPTVAWRTAASASDLDNNVKSVTSNSVDLDEDFEIPHECGCIIKNCKMCCAIIAYIAGCHVRSVAKRIPCADCVSVLYHSSADPCVYVSLIAVKNFTNCELSNKGLTIPSGSVMKILLECERQVRDYRLHLSDKNLLHTVTNNTLTELSGVELFLIYI